jgi:hypothetical protein
MLLNIVAAKGAFRAMKACLRILLLLASSHLAHSATYYVATNGNDAWPGTLGQPWKTIQKAANTLAPGDTVLVCGGVYSSPVTVNVSGSASGGYITFANHPGETPVIDASGITPPPDATGLFLVADRHHLVIRGFELRNYRTADTARIPAGVFIGGASHHIEIRGNNIHHIENTGGNVSDSGNAFGIAVYGTQPQPIADLIVDSNEVHHCRLGSSESVAVNGNVTNFQVTRNRVHDNNNIGIDFIGFEGTCSDPAQDQARDGVCRGNFVWNISSYGNPAYGNEYSAAGIYCDGATRVTIERNVVCQCDFGFELASEHPGKATSHITLRDNLCYWNRAAGLSLGGYNDTSTGNCENCVVKNNTFFRNDSLHYGGGEIQFQYRCRNNSVLQNIIVANAQNLLISNPGTGNVANVFNWNLYYCPGGSNAGRWGWLGTTRIGFAAWKSASGQDGNSIFADPKFVNATAPDLHLSPASPAVDAADPSALPAPGELDVDGGVRKVGPRMDIGADELALSGMRHWREFDGAPGFTSDAGQTPAHSNKNRPGHQYGIRRTRSRALLASNNLIQSLNDEVEFLR